MGPNNNCSLVNKLGKGLFICSLNLAIYCTAWTFLYYFCFKRFVGFKTNNSKIVWTLIFCGVNIAARKFIIFKIYKKPTPLYIVAYNSINFNVLWLNHLLKSLRGWLEKNRQITDSQEKKITIWQNCPNNLTENICRITIQKRFYCAFQALEPKWWSYCRCLRKQEISVQSYYAALTLC